MSGPALIIICGSRDIDDYDVVVRAIERTGWNPFRIVHGDAPGVDRLAEEWAEKNDVEVMGFAVTDEVGPKERNTYMAEYVQTNAPHGGGCICIPGPDSTGTWDMKRKAEECGLRVSVYQPHKHESQTELLEALNE